MEIDMGMVLQRLSNRLQISGRKFYFVELFESLDSWLYCNYFALFLSYHIFSFLTCLLNFLFQVMIFKKHKIAN